MKSKPDPAPMGSSWNTKRPVITGQIDGCYIQILINGVLHLKLDRNNLVAIQSWMWSVNWFKFRFKKRYFIEFTFKDGTDTYSEYYGKEWMWKEILRLLS